MPARKYNQQLITSIEWNNAVTAGSLPLTDTAADLDGSNTPRFRWNSTTVSWDMEINGAVVARIDSSGNLLIKGEVRVLQTIV